MGRTWPRTGHLVYGTMLQEVGATVVIRCNAEVVPSRNRGGKLRLGNDEAAARRGRCYTDSDWARRPRWISSPHLLVHHVPILAQGKGIVVVFP